MADKNPTNVEVEEKELVEAVKFFETAGPVTHYLSSGCTLLDLAIADRLPGGFPGGRISQIYGDESTGKTVLALEVLGSAQRQGGRAEMNDIEGTCDLDRAEQLHGINVKDPKIWGLCSSGSIEELFDVDVKAACEKSKKLKGPSAQATDSLSALSTKVEKETSLDKGTFGQSRPKQLSLAFRKYIDLLNSSNLALIFIDQTRDNVGVMFGDSRTTSGGRALKFYASVRVILTHMARIENSKKRVVGVKLGFFIKKNKIAAPFREGTFRVLFDYGIDDVGSSVEWLHENDPQLQAISKEREDAKKTEGEKKSVRTGIKQIKDDKDDEDKEKKSRIPWMIPALNLEAKSLDELCKKIEDGNLEKELAKEVERLWRIVYCPIERKPRVRIGN